MDARHHISTAAVRIAVPVLAACLAAVLWLCAAARPAAAGEIVADSGFRPVPDGFSFENYTDEEGYVNLDAAELRRMFGNQVCITVRDGRCILTGSARNWMRATNTSMGGGHCYGFAALSELIEKGYLERFGYRSLEELGGGPTTYDLPIAGNRVLQRSIARAWTFQTFESVLSRQIDESPSQVLQTLIDQLDPDNPEPWVMGIALRNLEAAHAITPYAVERIGSGVYDVHVYDNNYPGETSRRLRIDTNTETWSYEAQANPSEPSFLYEGDASTQTLVLLPTRPALGVQPCPFCFGRRGSHSPYTQVTLDASGIEHAHLLITDSEGRRTGYVEGRFVDEIPRVKVVPRTSGGPRLNAAGELVADSLEPLYRVPSRMRFKLQVDGRHLTRSERQTLTVVGPTFDATVRRLALEPGEVARLRLDPKRDKLLYAPAPATKRPTVSFAGESSDRKTAFQVTVSAPGARPGKRISFRKHARQGLLRISDATARPQRYVVRVDSRGAKARPIMHRGFRLRGGRRAYLHYAAFGTKRGPRLVITNAKGRILRVLRLRKAKPTNDR